MNITRYDIVALQVQGQKVYIYYSTFTVLSFIIYANMKSNYFCGHLDNSYGGARSEKLPSWRR